MSSFAARLEVGGRRYGLYRYELMMHQETDSLSRPASPVMGGTITCTLSSPGNQDPFLYQWMLSPTAQYDGLVRLLDPQSGATLKTVGFFNAYCTSMDLSFQPGQNGGAGSSVIYLQISPQRVAVGAIVHDNNWPVESHGTGQSFAKSLTKSDKAIHHYGIQDLSAQLSVNQMPELPQSNPQQKEYSMDPKEIRRVLEAKLKGEPYDKEQFLYYHLNRNKLNKVGKVTDLRKVGKNLLGYDQFEDNLGHIWTELPKKMNQYHMPPEEFEKDEDPPYSRKFVRDDNDSGIGGEFEMIIKRGGKRLDGETEPQYQETYNFGRTLNIFDNAEIDLFADRKLSNRHFKLDVDPHKENSSYESTGDLGRVEVQ